MGENVTEDHQICINDLNIFFVIQLYSFKTLFKHLLISKIA